MINQRKKRALEKFREDQAHIDYLLKKGWTSFEIADQLTHFMLVTLKEGVKMNNPNLSEEETKQKIKEIIMFEDKFKKKPRRVVKNG
jgi:hypothetical protein